MPGCRAHVVPGDQVLVLGGPRPVLLHGRPYALVVPLIDGLVSEDELVAALADRLPATVVHTVLLRLDGHGLLTHVAPGERLAAPSVPVPAGVVGAYAPPGAGRVRWVALGVQDAVVACLEAETAAATPSVDADRGLTVLVVDDPLREEAGALLARCADLGAPVLLVHADGPRWRIGPLCAGPDAAATGRLLRSRVRGNRPDDADALRRGATFPLRGASPVAEAARAAAIERVADVVGRIRRGDPPAAVVDGILELDAHDTTTTAHPLAVMGPAGAAPEETPDETWARMAALVDPVTGVVAGLEPVPSLPGTFVYASAGTLDWPDGGGPPVFRTGTLGKGLSDVQARISCVGEAIELVSCRFTGEEARRRARWSDVRDVAVHPRELLLFSDAQHAAAAREETPAAWDGVPVPFDEDRAVEWVPAVSLVDGVTRWLPAACCYVDYAHPDDLAPPFAVANANGCAAAGTREEATLRGLLELVERDATAMWWYGRTPRPEIDLDGLGDERVAAVRAALAADGRALTLLDLRVDTAVPVVAAVAWERATGTVFPTGHGCHPDPARAISRAVAELAQVMAIAAPAGPPPVVPATLDARPHLRPDGSPQRSVGDLAPVGIGDGTDARLRWCVDRLAALGHDVLVLDLTREELGQPAVRVVVPGLRPLLRRLVPGRLYDVPAALGWEPRARGEGDVNPDEFGT